jgi:hypothetical protein
LTTLGRAGTPQRHAAESGGRLPSLSEAGIASQRCADPLVVDDDRAARNLAPSQKE